MAFVLSDRIKVSTTTTGTSTYTLGSAVSGFETFTDNLSNGDTTYYCCTDGTDFEVGLGTFTSSTNKLSRTSIISSSNSNNAVSWSSGTRDIFCTLPGSKAVVLDANGALSTGITIQDEGSGLSTTATTLNFVGSGIVASGTGATKTITVTGGGIGTSTANYFDAHTSSDSSALTSSFATIDFDTIRYNSSGSVFSESGGEVTMTTTGIHRIHTDVTTKITSGSSRSDCEIELQRKPSGGSFSQIAGTTAITYNRNTNQGEQTSSIDILYNVTSGDAFRVVVKRQGGSDTIVVQGGAARFNISSVGANPSVATTAADDLTAGDAAVNLTTTSGNITIDAQGSDTDIILKGTDGSSDTTFLTLDGSDAGTATFNNKVVATGGIELPQTSGVAIKTTGSLSTADLTLLRASASTDGEYGFDIKYMGSRTGNANSYSLFMHNQQGTDVEAMTVLQDGKVGINQTTPTAPLHVGDTALFDDDVTFTGTSGNIVFDKSDDALEFADNVKAYFGTGNDFEIFDDGTVSRIQADRLLYLKGTGINFYKQNTSELMASMIQDGAVELYHNNVKKFETTAQGFGYFTSDVAIEFSDQSNNGVVEIGGSAGALIDLKSPKTDDFDFRLQVNTSNTAFVISDDLHLQSRTGAEDYLDATVNGAVNIYYDNVKKFETTSTGATVTGNLELVSTDAGASDAPLIELYRHSASPAALDQLGSVDFYGEDDNDDKVKYASVTGQIMQPTNGNERGLLDLNVMQNGSLQTFIACGSNLVTISKPLYLEDGATSIIFEGSTDNSNEITFQVADPSTDRTITLPDATGTVLTTGNSDTPTTTTSSADADFVLVDDGGTMKKITPANLGITSGGASKGFAVAMAIAL